jgi:hypothetical protein
MKTNFLAPSTGHVGTAALVCPVERSSTGFGAAADSRGQDALGTAGGTPALRKHEAAAWLTARLKSAWQILARTLREIFDESAYARFLKQRQLTSSRAAYAAFRQENEVAKARRPRCC